jgi:transposase InsO family protein
MLNVIDEFTHECLAIRVARKLKADDVIDVLSDLFILQGVPEHVRSDNGPEFVAKSVQAWINGVGTKTAYIAPGSPWDFGGSRERSSGALSRQRLCGKLQRPPARRTARG